MSEEIEWPDECYDEPFEAGFDPPPALIDKWGWGPPPDGFVWSVSCIAHHELLLRLAGLQAAATISEGFCAICGIAADGKSLDGFAICPCCHFGWRVAPDIIIDGKQGFECREPGLPANWMQYRTIRRSVAPIEWDRQK